MPTVTEKRYGPVRILRTHEGNALVGGFCDKLQQLVSTVDHTNGTRSVEWVDVPTVDEGYKE